VNLSKYSPGILTGILLAVLFFVALSFRVFLPYDQILGGEWVKFASVDAYFHMRLVDNLAHNFPHLIDFDPYFIYPGGFVVGNIYFFDWLMAGIIWVVSLGSPIQHTIDVIGAYFPAFLAALTVIPVYFIGKALFNRWTGVLAAALVALLPGEFLGRSILGFTDQHIAETLFSTVAVLFLILALKDARQKQLTFSHFMQRNWRVTVRPLVYSLLAGIFLGIYLITWQGALLFVFIITLYFVIQFIIDHLKRRSTDHLGIVGFILFLIALIIFLPLSPGALFSISLIFALFIPLVLVSVSRVMVYKQMKLAYYPITLVGIGIVAIAIFYVINPSLLGTMLASFRIFAPAGATAVTTLEMQPFLSPQGSFSTSVAWGNFTTSFFLTKSWPIPGFAIVSFIILIWLFIKRRGEEEHILLFLLWTLVILVATLVQRRFAYYLVVNMALLSAYISWQIIWLSGLRKLAAKPEEKPGKEHYYVEAPEKRDYYEILGIARSASKKEIKTAFRNLSHKYHPDYNRAPEAREKFKEINEAYEVLSNPGRRTAYDRSRREIPERKKTKKPGESRGFNMYYLNVILAIIVVFFFVFFFNIGKSREVAAQARFAPSDAWCSSLTWMKENTPEPFGKEGFYYELYEAIPQGESYDYPESAYGVTSWWDYGYWITRIAQRMPSANPGQAPEPITNIANLFLSQEEASAKEIIKKLDSSYIIVDYATVGSKFWAVITWAGQEQEEYFGIYHLPREGKLVPVQLFYPEYYRTMLVRLYNFDCQAITEEKPMVVAYDEKVNQEGNRYRQITNVTEFSSYQEALDYVESQGPANHRIVGVNPFISPIPQEAVASYKLIYSSESGITSSDVGMIPEVKIFEYLGD
jgi:oligosaccharyl transferase (archaeosortase A-associated)